MNSQETTGLGATHKKRTAPSRLDKFKLAVKPESKLKSLSQLLDSLPEEELSQLQSYGSMILKSTTEYSGSYYEQATRMYPRISEAKRLLLAELLQDIEAREDNNNSIVKKPKLKGYAQYGTPADTAEDVLIRMKGRVVELTEEEKAEQLKNKILESLEIKGLTYALAFLSLLTPIHCITNCKKTKSR